MSKATIWSAIARYCSELAPVVGPLLQAASDTAIAVERAATPRAALPASPEDD
jgi:hypothetical protein